MLAIVIVASMIAQLLHRLPQPLDLSPQRKLSLCAHADNARLFDQLSRLGFDLSVVAAVRFGLTVKDSL
jgi:hypothetical protein